MGLKILLVDDEPDILDILRIHLSAFDYEISTATNGIEALDHIEKNTPDVIFLDYSLPHVDGMTLLRLVKRIVPSAIVVMVSGRASQEVAKECLKHGAFDYIQKPFELDRITEILRAITLYFNA